MVSRSRKHKKAVYSFFKQQIDYCYWQVKSGLMFFDYESGPQLIQFSGTQGEKMIGDWKDGDDCYWDFR